LVALVALVLFCHACLVLEVPCSFVVVSVVVRVLLQAQQEQAKTRTCEVQAKSEEFVYLAVGVVVEMSGEVLQIADGSSVGEVELRGACRKRQKWRRKCQRGGRHASCCL